MKTARIIRILFIFICAVSMSNAAFAQTTAFSYQGRLSESGSPVTGSRFFRFTLFDENGAAIPGATVDQTLTVTNGVFNAQLDFGAAAFPGANRSLEIAVKINVGDAFTILNPRSPILAAPYSIKSKTAENSTQLGGVNSTGFVQQDAGGNVAVFGGLTVNGSLSLAKVNAATQYNLGGNRILSATGTENLFVGLNAGRNNTSGSRNTFAGSGAGELNTTGRTNTFVGSTAGQLNTTGISNSFFGTDAGRTNTTAGGNSFFGAFAGQNNSTGNENSFVGWASGLFNTTGVANSFFGSQAGRNATTGSFNSIFGRGAGFNNTADDNAFFGAGAGEQNTIGTNNTFVGTSSGSANIVGSRNSFFGRNAGRFNMASENSFFGFEAGKGNTTGDRNAFFGISAGTSNIDGCCNSFFGNKAGIGNLSGRSNSFFGGSAGRNNTTGDFNSYFGDLAGSGLSSGSNNTFIGNISGLTVTTGSFNTFLGSNTNGANNLTNATAIGANAIVSQSNALILGSNANVGIGTSTPNSKLTVVGLIETTTGGVQFPDGTIQTTAATSANAILNQTTTQAGANFNIAGSGIIGGSLTANSLFGNGAGLTNLNAGNITTGTLSNARLGLIPTANIADGAVTAQKIAANQVVKNLNGLTDNITLAAGANITITSAGNTLTIAATGGRKRRNFESDGFANEREF